VIPGNDDALRAIRLFASKIADSVAEGVQLLSDKQVADMSAATDAAQVAEAAVVETGDGAVAEVAYAEEGAGDDISMEEVLGAGVHKRPVEKETAETAPEVEHQAH
jgi:small subunit ribosomal protein S2